MKGDIIIRPEKDEVLHDNGKNLGQAGVKHIRQAYQYLHDLDKKYPKLRLKKK